MSKKTPQGRSHLKLITNGSKKNSRVNVYKANGSAQPMFARARKFSPEAQQPEVENKSTWLRDWSPFFATLILTAVVWFFVGYYLVKIANIGN